MEAGKNDWKEFEGQSERNTKDRGQQRLSLSGEGQSNLDDLT